MRSAKIKNLKKKPPLSFFGSIPQNAGDKFSQSKSKAEAFHKRFRRNYAHFTSTMVILSELTSTSDNSADLIFAAPAASRPLVFTIILAPLSEM